jgi:2-aminoadipate transaminase
VSPAIVQSPLPGAAIPYHVLVDATPTYTQNTLRGNVVELTFGEPDPALLPVGLVRAAADRMLAEAGPGALAYGQTQGPPALREQLARRIAAREGRAVPADEILVSGGNSQAFDLVLTMLTTPGDVVLVESPTYNLALGTLRDHPVEVVGVPLGDEGLDVDALERTLARLRSAGSRTRLLYTIPTFHNPAGVCLAPARRQRLVEIAQHWDLILVEDDVYRELAYDGPAPPSLWSAGPEAAVVRLGSFSKSLAPGLRVGWVNARRDIMERLRRSGQLDSGGCPSQFAATLVAEMLHGSSYETHVEGLRRAYASRRDALAAALREQLPAGCRFAVPAGGFFLWLTLPDGLRATELLPLAEAHGVAYAPGGRFCSDGDDRSLRLAFSLYDETTLVEGARRLGAALRAAQAGRA